MHRRLLQAPYNLVKYTIICEYYYVHFQAKFLYAEVKKGERMVVEESIARYGISDENFRQC